MVKPAAGRAADYAAKYDTTLIKARLDETKPLTLKNAGKHQQREADMEMDVQRILNGLGGKFPIMGLDRSKYYAYARAIAKRTRAGLRGPTLETWVNTSLGPEYVSKGCEPVVLLAIALTIFGITFTPP